MFETVADQVSTSPEARRSHLVRLVQMLLARAPDSMVAGAMRCPGATPARHFETDALSSCVCKRAQAAWTPDLMPSTKMGGSVGQGRAVLMNGFEWQAVTAQA